MPHDQTSEAVLASLGDLADPSEVERIARSFRSDTETSADNQFLGVRPGRVFKLAKQFNRLPIAEIERLLERPYYEARLAAVAIMDLQARSKRATAEDRRALFDLYLRRHDRINNWDLVDRAAPYVVGGYLADRPRDVLYELARSASPWERRTSIVATYFFIRTGEVEETFGIAEVLARDDHDLVQKAVGSWVREAGKQDRARLMRFLDAHAGTMPRVTLRYATEKLDPDTRASYF